MDYNTALLVSNLTWWTNEDEIREAFGEYGKDLQYLQILEFKSNGKSKGKAIVEFDSEKVASLARKEAEGKIINGARCSVTFIQRDRHHEHADPAHQKQRHERSRSRSRSPSAHRSRRH